MLALVWWIPGIAFIEVQTCSSIVWCLANVQNLRHDLVTGLVFSHTLLWLMVLKPFRPDKTHSYQQRKPNSKLLINLICNILKQLNSVWLTRLKGNEDLSVISLYYPHFYIELSGFLDHFQLRKRKAAPDLQDLAWRNQPGLGPGAQS